MAMKCEKCGYESTTDKKSFNPTMPEDMRSHTVQVIFRDYYCSSISYLHTFGMNFCIKCYEALMEAMKAKTSTGRCQILEMIPNSKPEKGGKK